MDLVDVAEVEESLARFGDRYLQRVFTQREVAACSNGTDARLLAAHFAAKEAALKTMLVGGEGMNWRSIEIQLDRGGSAPEIKLSGTVADVARREGIVTFSVSVSATKRHATAVVVAEGPRTEAERR
jgi:holo-[acyl-carrier protein] synthase